MLRSPEKPALLRLFGAALTLSAIALLAASCVDALGLEGYEQGYSALCDAVKRCYGEGYESCETRAESAASDEWIGTIANGCLESCGQLADCLDRPPMCRDPRVESPAKCALDIDCCGSPTGTLVCAYGACCTPLGVDCVTDQDCCPNTGFCLPVEAGRSTCGGIVCGQAGDACLNDFQCCSGQCTNGACEEKTCPPEGYACESDAECCDLACVLSADGTKRCGHPTCKQAGDTCTSNGDCCDEVPVCYRGTPDAPSGICSTGECIPNNADCAGDDDCCTGFCHPSYHLCGECAGDGASCGGAITCCTGLACDANTQECVLQVP